MSNTPENRVFAFPADLTRRERLEFSRLAGVTIQAFAIDLREQGRRAMTVEGEAALILIAARREIGPAVTFDEVLDHDDWILGEPEDPDPLGATSETESADA